MRPKFITLSFLFLTVFLQAQKVISLGKPDIQVSVRRFNIAEVVDARMDTAFVGLARVGGFNHKTLVALKQGTVRTAVKEWLQQALPNKLNLPEVLVKINRLGVWEEVGFAQEMAKVSADFDFYYQKDGTYIWLGDLHYWHNESTGLDVTKFHNDNLRGALQAACHFLTDSVHWNNLPTALASPDKVVAPVVLPILTDSSLKVGAYRNFREFRDNHPTVSCRIEEKDSTKVLLIEGKRGKFRRVISSDHLWGFYDGQNLYFNQRGTFFPLENKQGRFQFRGFDIDQVYNSMSFGVIGFGIIGGVVSYALAKQSRSLYFIDWESGNFYH